VPVHNCQQTSLRGFHDSRAAFTISKRFEVGACSFLDRFNPPSSSGKVGVKRAPRSSMSVCAVRNLVIVCRPFHCPFGRRHGRVWQKKNPPPVLAVRGAERLAAASFNGSISPCRAVYKVLFSPERRRSRCCGAARAIRLARRKSRSLSLAVAGGQGVRLRKRLACKPRRRFSLRKLPHPLFPTCAFPV